jgi:hypothetical protein
MDLRYWIEGMLERLRSKPKLHEAWQIAGRAALKGHLEAVGRGVAKGNLDVVTSDGEQDGGRHEVGVGTGGEQAAEGAHARKTERTSDAKHDERKALQIGDDCFQWLKRIQDSTQPRLEMRYLLEGATALLKDQPEHLPAVVSSARHALAKHMVQLKDEAVQPFTF